MHNLNFSPANSLHVSPHSVTEKMELKIRNANILYGWLSRVFEMLLCATDSVSLVAPHIF